VRVDTEPGDFRTGVLVLLAIGLVVAGVIWVSPARGPRPIEFYTEMRELGGVSLETPVVLNGFKVGQVDKVDPYIAGDGRLHFHVGMAITWQPSAPERTPYREGLHVRVAPPALDVFGSATLHLEPAARPGAPLASGTQLPSDADKNMLAKADSRIDSLAREVAQTLAETRAMMASFRATAEASSEAVRGAGAMTSKVDAHLVEITAGTMKAVARADSAMQALQHVELGAKNATDSVNALLGDTRSALRQVSAMLGKTGPRVDEALFNLDESTSLLSHFLRNITERPTRLLTGVTPLPARVWKDTSTRLP
jgi:ABC-type transporter Mla subunit MlaD